MVGLVIFDCDGVLVDSESLAIPVLASKARLAGSKLTNAEAFTLFRGQRFAHSVAEIEKRSGIKLPEHFETSFREELALTYEAQLQSIAGIHETLTAITCGFCVASNAPLGKIRQNLKIAGLLAQFEDHIFSAYEVGSWKPDPKLFLHAASTMGVEPSRCLVVEDSIYGIEAAKAAGMKVFGFTNGEESVEQSLRGSEVPLFHNMTDLPHLIAFESIPFMPLLN